MKETLPEENRNDLIQYRLSRATETLKEAELLLNSGFYNATINRLYYACYYATIALFLKHNLVTHTHSGAKTMLGLQFIKTGIFPIEIGKTFSTLFEKRQTGDYDDFFFCDKEMVDELYAETNKYIQTLSEYINRKQ